MYSPSPTSLTSVPPPVSVQVSVPTLLPPPEPFLFSAWIVTEVPPPHVFAVPSPPQVVGELQVPHELTVRETPQLSLAVTEPQLLPSRWQNAGLLSSVQPPPPPVQVS